MLWLVRTTPGAYGRNARLTGMHPRARIPHAALGMALALVLLACGGTTPGEDEPSEAAQACRDSWKKLESTAEAKADQTHPSALAARWTSVAATIDYYVTSAPAKGCNAAIERQEDAITALEGLSTKLAAYDVELQFAKVRDDAEEYAGGPRPSPGPSASASPEKKGAVLPPLPPTPELIAASVRTLVAQAPAATEQQGPGWQQARVVELTDDAAVAKTVKDLAFLSSQSPAWRACTAALARIDAALAAAG